MKFHLIVAVLSCALLSLSYANVTETEQSQSQLEEEPQNVDKQIAAVEEPLEVASPEVQKVLIQIPELVRAAAKEQITDDGIEDFANNTEAIAVPQKEEETTLPNNREPKQLIGFIPTYVLRQAIRMAQEQQSNDVRSLRYDNDEDDESNEIEEERAIRRRKRFRRRNSRGHLKKSRRHKNINKRKLKKRRNFNAQTSSKRKYQSERESVQRRKKPKSKKRKTNKRRQKYD